MKQIIVLLMLIVLTTEAYSQSFVDEGNVWTYATEYRMSFFYDSESEDVIIFDPDTLIYEFIWKFYFNGTCEYNGKTYHRLWYDEFFHSTKYENHFPDTTMISNSIYCTKMREENGKVYIDAQEYDSLITRYNRMVLSYDLDEVYERVGNEYIIYDFTKEQENVLPWIGSTNNLVFPSGWTPVVSYYNGRFTLENLNLFFRNGVLEYKNVDHYPGFHPDPFFPDEVADGIELTTSTPDNNGSIYNLQGQRTSRPTKGIHIIGGRKVLVK